MSGINPCLVGLDPDPAVRRMIDEIGGQLELSCAVFSTAEEFLSQHDLSRPGCLVTELRLDDQDGIEVLAAIRDRDSRLVTIFYSSAADVASTVVAMRAGAWTVLEKPLSTLELKREISQVLDKPTATPGAGLALGRLGERFDRLTPKEMDVLRLMLDGEPNKSIAKRLGIGLRTVEARRQNVFLKTGTDSLAELIRLVFETTHAPGLTPHPGRTRRLAGILDRPSQEAIPEGN